MEEEAEELGFGGRRYHGDCGLKLLSSLAAERVLSRVYCEGARVRLYKQEVSWRGLGLVDVFGLWVFYVFSFRFSLMSYE